MSGPRVGVCILPDAPWREAERRWRLADELGFAHAWTYDHLTWGGLPGHEWYAAIPTLTAAALRTSRIGLGTFVSSPNNHHPAQFIREIAALADIAGDRVLLGIGSGGTLDAQTVAPDLTLRGQTERFAEFTEAMARLLRHTEVTFAGEYFQLAEARTDPGPLNSDARVRVPLLVAANGPRAIELAVTHGEGWVTYGGSADTQEDWWQVVGEVVTRLEEQLERSGRTRPLRRVLGLDSAPIYSFASVDAFADAHGRAGELGFTDVVAAWPRAADPYAGSEDVVIEVAGRFCA